MVASPWDVIQQLHDSEISAGVQTDWPSGLVVWLGEITHPRVGMRDFSAR